MFCSRFSVPLLREGNVSSYTCSIFIAFIPLFQISFVNLRMETKHVRIMTALQLNAELYRAMGDIADNETLLAKVLKYVKSLAPAKTENAEMGWADQFAGAWKDSRSTEEIINDIRESRMPNN